MTGQTDTHYGVFLHAVNRVATGRGLVARKIDAETRRPHDQQNYGGMNALRIFKTERGANYWIDRRAEEARIDRDFDRFDLPRAVADREAQS